MIFLQILTKSAWKLIYINYYTLACLDNGMGIGWLLTITTRTTRVKFRCVSLYISYKIFISHIFFYFIGKIVTYNYEANKKCYNKQ